MSETKPDVRLTKLDNGLTLVTERIPHVRSVSIGVWIRGGSRVEPPELNGMSHFIEHTVFKGTSKRSAHDITSDMDAIGGQLDAFTSKELVCFNARVIDENLPQAFEILSDLVLDPIFPADEIKREQNVILEEIRMDEDSPEYLAQEIFSQSFWPGHPLGRPILGTAETVPTFDRDRAQAFYREWYCPANIFITAAGNLDHDRFAGTVSAAFAALSSLPSSSSASDNGSQQSAPTAEATLTTRVKKDLTQAQLLFGAPCYELTHEKRYGMGLLATILGGGMSSRLFQRIREQEGLAYAVYADVSAYRDTGCFAVSAGTAPETVPRVLELACEEIARMKNEPVPEDELRRAKESLKGGILLSLESTSSRMGNLARQQIYFGRLSTVDEILRRVESVTVEEIQTLANEIFDPHKTAATVLGDLRDFSLHRDQLKF